MYSERFIIVRLNTEARKCSLVSDYNNCGEFNEVKNL